MGFWDAMRKMVQGKPVFEVEPQGLDSKGKAVDEWGDPLQDADPVEPERGVAQQPVGSRRVDAHGNKIMPEVEICQVEPRYSGEMVELWVTIRNTSQFPVFLDKSYIFGVKQELDYPLSPSGQREFMIYRGNRPAHDNYKYAELYYRDEGSGDYFCAAHTIHYRHQSDGTFDIVDFDLVRPIKDV